MIDQHEHLIVKDEDHCINEINKLQNNQFRNNVIGMILQTISVFFLISAYALFKYAFNTLKISLFECIIVSNFVQHISAWILWLFIKKPAYNKLWYGETEYRHYIWFHGFFYWLDLYLYTKGLSLIPIGDAEAIYFLSPIFVAFGGRIFLKETFPRSISIILLLIIIGVTVICQPKWLTKMVSGDNNSNSDYYVSKSINIWGVVSLFIGCVAWAGMSLLVRKAQKAHYTQLGLVSSLQAFVIWTPILMAINCVVDINLDNNGFWKFTLETFGVLAAIGLLTVIGLLLSVVSYQCGETTKVSWMEYLNLPFGYLYQTILSADYPNIYETIGGSVVMSTCIVNFIEQYCEYQKHRKDTNKR